MSAPTRTCLALVILLACSKSSTPAPDTAANHGGASAPKLAAADITPALLASLADAKTSPERVVHRAHGVYEQFVAPGAGGEGEEQGVPDKRTRLCGADADQRVAAFAATLRNAQARGEKDGDHQLVCEARGPSTILCESSGPVEYDHGYQVWFVADETLGYRLAGILTWEIGLNLERLMDEMAAEAAKTSTCAK